MKINQQSYKGVRDFYPEDFKLLAYIFEQWSKVAERYGFERYDASVVEYLKLYQLKSQTNTDILKHEIYTFIDRGQRQVALRPEMTPTLARLVAARRQDLIYPLRWYSIPNLWRYERPQKGRRREHWQLNVDVLGVPHLEAELELILMARDILEAFGAEPSMYQICVSSRAVLEALLSTYVALTPPVAAAMMPLLDRYHKLTVAEFEARARQILTTASDNRQTWSKLNQLIHLKDLNELPSALAQLPACQALSQLLEDLKTSKIHNAVLDLKIVRGFDYYTGVVFEIFDTAPDNQRSMFGGGRYDNLLQAFGVDPLAGVGFGMGDVTTLDFLRTHQLLPDLATTTDLGVILEEDVAYAQVADILQTLRTAGLKVVVDSRPIASSKKLETVLRRDGAYVLWIKLADLKEAVFNLKYLPTKNEERLSLAQIVAKLRQAQS